MKVLLIYPLDREFMPPSMFPMGLGYIASELNSAGHEITVIDLNGDRNKGIFKLKEELLKKGFGMIGISSIITQYKKVKELGKIIKSVTINTPLVMGGAGPTSIPELYLKNCYADIVCLGEGEETTKELACLIEQNKSLETCNGIVFKNSNNSFIYNSPRKPITDINLIKFPAWDMFNSISIYIENYLFRQNRLRGMSIFSTRGCPGFCNYCMCNFGRKLRIRTAENIFTEIELLFKNYGVEHIHFIDDTFITTSKNITDICYKFKTHYKNLTWSANVRANLVNPDILKCMANSNCISLAYGIESGSNRILKEMKKGVTSKQASDAIKWTREVGIKLTAYFMIGMPSETRDTIRETVEFCKENLVGGEFFFATPFPGTELYQYAKKNGLINNEDIYLELAGEVRNFLVNLTKMSNEQLFTLKENAEAEIQEYLKKHNISFKPSIRENPWITAARLPKF